MIWIFAAFAGGLAAGLLATPRAIAALARRGVVDRPDS